MGLLSVPEYEYVSLQAQYLDLILTLLIWAIALYIYFVSTLVAQG